MSLRFLATYAISLYISDLIDYNVDFNCNIPNLEDLFMYYAKDCTVTARQLCIVI